MDNTKVLFAWPNIAGVISNPANSTVSAPNTNLSGLSIILLCPQMWSHLVKVICPKVSVVNAFCFVREVGDNLVKPS